MAEVRARYLIHLDHTPFDALIVVRRILCNNAVSVFFKGYEYFLRDIIGFSIVLLCRRANNEICIIFRL